MNNDDIFSSIVKDKTVALVGPAAYLHDKHLGVEIDDHDVVVRINRGIELIRLFPEDVGVKSDILYSCLIETAANAGFLDVNELDEMGVKLICAPPESDMKGISRATRLHSMVNHTHVKQIKRKIPIRIVDHVFHTNLAKKISSRPNTGFMAIYDLLAYEPKRLSIYGFSFYLDGFMKGCKSGIENEKGVSEQGFADLAFNSKRHVQKNMWAYAKESLPHHKSVHLDETLKSILNLDTLERGKIVL